MEVLLAARQRAMITAPGTEAVDHEQAVCAAQATGWTSTDVPEGG